MRWRALRPVGEPLVTFDGKIRAADLLPPGFRGYFVDSGTSALALALVAARRMVSGTRMRVLLPAYGCPDLVAAAKYAGLDPFLVDTHTDSPFYRMDALESVLDGSTAAVVCAHFLGLRENVADIQTMADAVGAVVIEDSAQVFPDWPEAPSSSLVTYSFGRGKPPGGLGGGLLLVPEDRDIEIVEPPRAPRSMRRTPLRWLRGIHNIALQPFVFPWLALLPFLKIGETRYQALKTIYNLEDSLVSAALSQIKGGKPYVAGWRDRARRIVTAIDHESPSNTMTALAARHPDAAITRLPLLFDSPTRRNRVYSRLQSQGLGASIMYGASLAHIPNMPPVRHAMITGAEQFAQRLLTLPLHSDVTAHDLGHMVRAVVEDSSHAQ